ncbi:hypothetical protein G6L63_11060 [Agrobacterium vitis]|uniref:hypothetical protein n=1 Tax=Agrobacterium vitis TaxID=373 RepID=UPI0015737172|nr:hypothetical protein [Agrobacterium vitis]NSZ48448.1 hypothetical protein [Agrobacterium vitis]UJL73044.1 hypothetical protein AVCG412_09590 [Agrobacterium vitis]
MTNPQTGGSYRREQDGTLTRIEANAPVTVESETTVAEPTTETSDAVEETSAKKGKA